MARRGAGPVSSWGREILVGKRAAAFAFSKRAARRAGGRPPTAVVPEHTLPRGPARVAGNVRPAVAVHVAFVLLMRADEERAAPGSGRRRCDPQHAIRRVLGGLGDQELTIR